MKRYAIFTLLALTLVGCNHKKDDDQKMSVTDTPDVKNVYFSGIRNGDHGIKDELFFPNGKILNADNDENKTEFITNINRTKGDTNESKQ